MAERPDPRQISQRELDEYLDDLVRRGMEETPEFEHAYAVWEAQE